MAPSINAQVLAALQDLQKQMTQMVTTTTLLTEDTKRVVNTTDKINRALYGGNGGSGLIARIELLERNDRECEIERVVDALDGNDKDPGLIERVRRMEGLAKDIRYWIFLMIGAVILGLINAAFSAAPKFLAMFAK